jgi:hypothetical protein
MVSHKCYIGDKDRDRTGYGITYTLYSCQKAMLNDICRPSSEATKLV